MASSRRRFLAQIGLAAAAAGVGALFFAHGPARRWLLTVPLTPSGPGPLLDSTADTLRATTLALLDDRVEPRDYVEVFAWRAARLRGARGLYERFERVVDREARRRGHTAFRVAPRPLQQRILRGMIPARRWTRARRVFLARDEARFAEHIVGEVFARFARTDAWVLAGYEAWPGMPRAIASLGPMAPRS
jgi:hypothetical protein